MKKLPLMVWLSLATLATICRVPLNYDDANFLLDRLDVVAGSDLVYSKSAYTGDETLELLLALERCAKNPAAKNKQLNTMMSLKSKKPIECDDLAKYLSLCVDHIKKYESDKTALLDKIVNTYIKLVKDQDR